MVQMLMVLQNITSEQKAERVSVCKQSFKGWQTRSFFINTVNNFQISHKTEVLLQNCLEFARAVHIK